MRSSSVIGKDHSLCESMTKKNGEGSVAADVVIYALFRLA